MGTKFRFISYNDGTCCITGLDGDCADTDVVIPAVAPNGDIVTGISGWAFSGCKSLTGNITFEENSQLTSISSYAFGNCTGIKSIKIPDSVTGIGHGAFYGCVELTSIVIPNNVVSIGGAAFYGCTNLKSATIPKCAAIVGGRAFAGCESLKNYSERRFKATDGKMRCLSFQYEMNKWYEIPDVQLCKTGFHSCSSPLDVLNYYYGFINEDVRFFEVETQEESPERNNDSKHVAKRIRFIKELTLSELAELASNVT